MPLEPAEVLPVGAGFGLPNIVLSDVFLLGAKTELKSCPIPRVVLHPATHAATTANARSRENMVSLQGLERNARNLVIAMAVPAFARN